MPSKTQEGKQLERFLEQRRKKRTQEDSEENIRYGVPTNEGDASDADLAKQTDELMKEKQAFDSKQAVKPLDDIEAEGSDDRGN